MAQNESDYEFYVGPATHLEGASLAIDGTARIDGKIVGKVAVKHLIVGPGGIVQGDISGETAKIEGIVEDSLQLSGKLTVCASGKIRGNIKYGSIETMEGAKLVGEISTDWDAGDTSIPQVSDRLEAFTAALADNDTETDSDLV
jgi:cytoskeletal protein CcmA (bactofilin family)